VSGKVSIIIEKDEHGYYAYCPELPGCQTQASSVDQAVERMREAVDLWIVAMKQSHPDPLREDLGGGFIGATGYFVFTDRGGRLENAVFDIEGNELDGAGGHDFVNPKPGLAAFVRERDPKRIGVNMSDDIGAADGLSFTHHQLLVKTLGEPYASRLVSAEKLVSDFPSRRVASEIVVCHSTGNTGHGSGPSMLRKRC
jgi:predicted RNase H-like HicB family nuclease